MSNIEWQFFPKYLQCPKHLIDVVDLFENIIVIVSLCLCK